MIEMTGSTFTVHTGVSFDPKKKAFVDNVSLKIDRETGAIVDVYTRDSSAEETLSLEKDDIDLRKKIVLPGLVDSHTHVFLHAYKERNATEQMRDASIVERTVRATNAARAALLAGYTTYRDLGTETLGNADVNLRDSINRGLIPGPRMFVATEALASSGSYELRIENRLGQRLIVPRACDAADGVAGVQAAVRRRAGDGADIIKFYADYRRKVLRFPLTGPRPVRFPPAARRNPAVTMFSQEEMDAIVQEAHRAEMPVAAHTGETRAAIMASKAGVTTVEHALEDTDEKEETFFETLKENGTIWVPTITAIEVEADDVWLEDVKQRVKRGFNAGVKIAAGGDTGVFDHGLNAREMELLVEAGIPLEEVLIAGTLRGWEACGGDRSGYRFGWFEKGNRADIIALDADPRKDTKALRKVSFVMKDGEVWKRDGQVVTDMVVQLPRWSELKEPSPSPTLSDEWTELGDDQPTMTMSVPLPVFTGKPAGSD
ncbi:putative Xaa-Pro dipeptide hydrolase [Echria macrotheca]|uniref:Xaa-Pro dipeptide hydrolase n=1 Tax=Echria macrotheca TaxID=438768 RepID=A0AAJ0F6J6_9PEZI|nr:putative Xaa-Pro dipeptide hydrolase [Echria macrotheca]